MSITPYYDEGGITIFHGRCEDILPAIAAASIDAVITDPPYGTTACAWDTPIDFAFMWRELKRVTKRNAAIVLFGSQPFTSALVMSNPGMFRYDWVWRKNRCTGYLNAGKRPLMRAENITVFADGQSSFNPQFRHVPERFVSRSGGYSTPGKGYGKHDPVSSSNNGLEHPSNVLDFPVEADPLHPTQKPLALLEYLILTYTNPGDTVLDFTAGSGTTPAAAKKLGRKCIAIEQELEYCEIAVSRLQQEVLPLW